MSTYFRGLPSIRLDTFIRGGPGKHKKRTARPERTRRGALAFSPNIRGVSALRTRTPFVDGVPSFQMADRLSRIVGSRDLRFDMTGRRARVPQSTAKNENCTRSRSEAHLTVS